MGHMELMHRVHTYLLRESTVYLWAWLPALEKAQHVLGM
jgi:hypothetical protein